MHTSSQLVPVLSFSFMHEPRTLAAPAPGPDAMAKSLSQDIMSSGVIAVVRQAKNISSDELQSVLASQAESSVEQRCAAHVSQDESVAASMPESPTSIVPPMPLVPPAPPVPVSTLPAPPVSVVEVPDEPPVPSVLSTVTEHAAQTIAIIPDAAKPLKMFFMVSLSSANLAECVGVSPRRSFAPY
jgi:hypothetical protein